MAFSFGSTPAPAASGFSFGGTPAPAAPAPATGLFGSTPAPAATGGLFGSTPAPAAGGGLFGSAPAPAGGLFGSAPAPAPTGGLFGSATPAPAAGGLFGSTRAPAPGSLFGSAAPAPSGGLFGSTSTSTAFGAQPQQTQQQQYSTPLSSNTPYSQLPPNLRNAIDDIYRHIMSHRRTLVSVKSMAPALLADTSDSTQPADSGADAAAGSPAKKIKTSNLANQLQDLHHSIEEISIQAKENIDNAAQLKQNSGEAVAMAKMHGLWPVEMVAARRSVILSSLRKVAETPTTTGEGSKSATTLSNMPEMDVLALQHIMDMRAASVDRKENIPSPYFWEVMRNLEKRTEEVGGGIDAMNSRLRGMEEADRSGSNQIANYECAPSLILCDQGPSTFPARCAKLARIQNEHFLRIASGAARLHEEVETTKVRYRRMQETLRGIGQYDDPFFKADVEEMRREREMQQKIIEERLLANAAAPAAPTGAPAPGGGGLFGAPAPASGGLFGSTMPAPVSGGLFGSTTPAPASGGLFGSTAPAPATGGLFGAPAPAPAGGGLFGAPAPAPAGGGLFGSAPAPATAAPAAGGLFGTAAPAPAASGGLFGTPAAAPAAAGTSLFAAPTTPASTLAPRKKPGSRSGGRRR